jgi:hypothetical protein
LDNYLGIIVDHSLKNQEYAMQLQVLASRSIGSWRLLLIEVEEEKLAEQIQSLQNNMVDIQGKCWYAHFFRQQELIVVYQDRIFPVTVQPDTWGEAIQYGLTNGIPEEQLDFQPCFKSEAHTLFQLTND